MESHRLLALFLTEGRELLNRVDAELMVLERAPHSRGSIDAAFRSLHSLKGMSATVGMESTAAALHAGESLLDAARSGMALSGDLLDALFALTAGTRHALDAAEHRLPEPGVLLTLANRLEGALAASRLPVSTVLKRPEAAQLVRDATTTGAACWCVAVLIATDAEMPEARATLLLRRLSAIAPVVRVAPDEGTRASDDWDRRMTIWLGEGSSVDHIEQVARGTGDIGECHVVREVVPSLGSRHVEARTVRIPAQRLDDLLDLVGELVLVRDRLLRVALPMADEPTTVALDEASGLVGKLRDAILQSRLVPMADIMDRFPRHVHDMAHSLGKDVELVMEGRELEVDRSLLEELSEPLLHLLRNAVDHGVERPEDRRASGKPARGRLVVRVARDGAMVAVTVGDDGAGVCRDRVIAAARARGIVPATSEALDDAGLLTLLAIPGLSTASEVTALSGRGVGVNAVVHRVQSLGGRVDLATVPGAGTAFTIRLPLSVAMLRALLVRVANETYAIPLSLVHTTSRRGDHAPADDVAGLQLHGEHLRIVSLRSRLGLPVADDVSGHLVVLDGSAGRFALLVDACIAQQEIVVKPLQRVRGAAPRFSGGTILSDGTPSLILDINSLN